MFFSQFFGLSIKRLLTGGLILTLTGLLFDIRAVKQRLVQAPDAFSAASSCKVAQSHTGLSREQLAQLLTVPERDSKARIQQIVDAPACRYPTLEVRAGAQAEREAYALAFAPATTLVILYEADEYAGYHFKLR
ncbi:MAG: hypothetical protein F6J97_13820 [Leptolyngbya sp. SIO4C1]|nr:hypothetical protein [Leptolyngbya sp. SIO4C1]